MLAQAPIGCRAQTTMKTIIHNGYAIVDENGQLQKDTSDKDKVEGTLFVKKSHPEAIEMAEEFTRDDDSGRKFSLVRATLTINPASHPKKGED